MPDTDSDSATHAMQLAMLEAQLADVERQARDWQVKYERLQQTLPHIVMAAMIAIAASKGQP